MEIIMYSTGCPRCKVLEKKLNSKGLEYSIISDIEVMTNMGFREVPILSVDGKQMNFKTAVKWVNERG